MTDYLTGLQAHMSNADYHGQPHIGSTGFKKLARSPLHFWHDSPLNPDRPAREPSHVMTIGTAWHTGIWEPELFDSTYAEKPDLAPTSTVALLLAEALQDYDAWQQRYVKLPDGVGKTTKEGKALLAELAASDKFGIEPGKYDQVIALAPPLLGKTLLSADSLAAVKKAVDAARQHQVTRAIFNLPGGMAEHSIFWIDGETGAPCRVRPDYMVPPCDIFPTGLIIDGKTNDDSSPEAFARSAWNGEMFYQAAFYSDGYQQHYGTDAPPVFAWLAQERAAPHATAYYAAPPDFTEYGRQKYRRLLRTYAACMQSGNWPGYANGVQDLSLPAYAAKAIDETVAQ